MWQPTAVQVTNLCVNVCTLEQYVCHCCIVCTCACCSPTVKYTRLSVYVLVVAACSVL